LFGLYQARDGLARGAVPVIAEGPFDAIAVTRAGQDSYAGPAPGGTALTSAHTEGPLLAMRSVAAVIADLPPAETAEAIRRITGNQELPTADEHMHPIANPPLPQIVGELRAAAAFQITRTAERLGFTDYSDVLAEVANAVTRKPLKATDNSYNATPMLVEASFPRPPPAARTNAEPTTTPTQQNQQSPEVAPIETLTILASDSPATFDCIT
jgi:hypothetical protein